MIFVLQFLMCVVVFELFIVMDLRKGAYSILQLSKEAMGVLTSSEIEDDEKEVFARRASLRILKTTGTFVAKFLLIFVALYVMYAIAVELFSVSGESFVQMMLSLHVLLKLTVMSIVYGWIRHGIRRRL